MIDHVSIEVRDLAKARTFYLALLEPLGLNILRDTPETVGFGKKYPEFWLNLREDMPNHAPTSGAHVCLRGPSAEAIDNFYRIALEHGCKDDGKPGLRAHYTDNYYATFIQDVDGNRIEAVTFLK